MVRRLLAVTAGTAAAATAALFACTPGDEINYGNATEPLVDGAAPDGFTFLPDVETLEASAPTPPTHATPSATTCSSRTATPPRSPTR